MLMLIRYYDGRREGAVLLSVTGNAMRVALAGRDDCLELRLYEGQWVTETNQAVEIEFVARTADEAWFEFAEVAEGFDDIVNVASMTESVTTTVS